MDIKISTDEKQVQMVEITPTPIQRPTQKMSVELFISQLNAQKISLQEKIDIVDAQLAQLSDLGVEVVAIQNKLSKPIIK